MSEHGREIFSKVFRILKPRTPIPEIAVSFRPYADANHVIRVREGKVIVGLSDLLEGAPHAVLEAIAFILVSKLCRKPVPARYQDRYRRFLNRRSVRNQVHAIRRVRGRKWLGTPAGEHYHLEEIFDDLSGRYFSGLMARPRLTWSRGVSRTLLGHFDDAHNAIVISRIFDRAETPRFLLEYILFHEMLHLKHPVSHRRSPQPPLRPLCFLS
jgi:hypothetical protein